MGRSWSSEPPPPRGGKGVLFGGDDGESEARFMQNLVFRDLNVIHFVVTAFNLMPREHLTIRNVRFEDIRLTGDPAEYMITLGGRGAQDARPRGVKKGQIALMIDHRLLWWAWFCVAHSGCKDRCWRSWRSPLR
jgi:hypothetical protein